MLATKESKVNTAHKGSLVLIHVTILSPQERAANIPDSTKQVPYEMWVKGFLANEHAQIGDTVEIETLIGRRLTGTLTEISPAYTHTFGKPPIDLLVSSLKARQLLRGDSDESY